MSTDQILDLPAAFHPKTGSLEAWNAAYVRVEDYLRAHRVHNRLHQIRLGTLSAVNQFGIILLTKEKRTRFVSATIAPIPETGLWVVSLIDITGLCYFEETLRKNGMARCIQHKPVLTGQDAETGNA